MSVFDWATIHRASMLSILGMLTLLAPCKAESLAESGYDQPAQELVEKPAEARTSRVEGRKKLENYKGKNGVLSAKTVIMGGTFRVTTVVPFKGNLADYHQLEITKPISLVGGALKPSVSSQQIAKIRSQFASKRIFDSVTVIDLYSPELAAQHQIQLQTSTYAMDGEEADSLDAPIGRFEDMEARDRRRAMKESAPAQPSTRTLVTVIEVLDYAKGSRLKQVLPLDLGKSILTIRLRYYDKDTGQEVGRQIISGESNGSSLLGPLAPRDALSGVADGFVDQVTRRVAASAR
jgi:hypothetical protein